MPDSGFRTCLAALKGAAFSFVLLLAACASNPDDFGGSREAAVNWSAARGFVTVNLDSGGFSILALARGRGSNWSVYFEGDGAAWPNAFSPPADPTPVQPVALAMAAVAPDSAVLYLGRPCQYLDNEARSTCSVEYWTDKRFSMDVINSYQKQLDFFKDKFNVQRFRLVGYSGGGVIATLLAARRNDVEQLITVASPISLQGWTDYHQLSPLSGSEDPLNESTHQLPLAWHFVGKGDRIVPSMIIENFVRLRGGRLLPVAEFDHECCWSRDWPALLEKTQ